MAWSPVQMPVSRERRFMALANEIDLDAVPLLEQAHFEPVVAAAGAHGAETQALAATVTESARGGDADQFIAPEYRFGALQVGIGGVDFEVDHFLSLLKVEEIDCRSLASWPLFVVACTAQRIPGSMSCVVVAPIPWSADSRKCKKDCHPQ